jgi:subtilase family serine protease
LDVFQPNILFAFSRRHDSAPLIFALCHVLLRFTEPPDTDSLLDWVNQIMAMEDPPLVHSVSYGNDEIQQTSTEYMEACNTQFEAAGAMGLSLLFASGDQGVWGRSGVGATYNPDFPASSPYITAVGGTNFATKSVIGEESACKLTISFNFLCCSSFFFPLRPVVDFLFNCFFIC